ncbi:hypothetical protein T484DRAFT_1786476 [Baffinella frigidus]|nr:hypothetical protein T484DRAFT_1786476 [Cryptophyta sp. CCMP2293]
MSESRESQAPHEAPSAPSLRPDAELPSGYRGGHDGAGRREGVGVQEWGTTGGGYAGEFAADEIAGHGPFPDG